MRVPVITDIELFLVQAPVAEADTPVRTVLFHLVSDLGTDGWGEAQLAWRPTELTARREMLLNILAGRSVFDLEELGEIPSLRPAALRCGIELACWDLVGRFLGQPVCRLLGGEYRHYVPLAVRLPTDRSHLPEVALELLHQGFDTQILSTSGQVDADAEAVQLLTQLGRGRIRLRLDGAGAFDWEAGRKLCELLEDQGLECLIDPLRDYDPAELASLGRQTELPLAAWRSVSSPREVMAIVRAGAAKTVIIELQRVGGILPARYSGAIARAGGLEVALASGPSLGIAAAALLHLAGANPAFATCNECGYFSMRDDVLSRPIERVQGLGRIPLEPGFGVNVDRNKLEVLQVPY